MNTGKRGLAFPKVYKKGAAPFGTAPRPAARSARGDVHEVSRGVYRGFKADIVGSLARLRITECGLRSRSQADATQSRPYPRAEAARRLGWHAVPTLPKVIRTARGAVPTRGKAEDVGGYII